jgi:hypothetical protein
MIFLNFIGPHRFLLPMGASFNWFWLPKTAIIFYQLKIHFRPWKIYSCQIKQTKIPEVQLILEIAMSLVMLHCQFEKCEAPTSR